MERERIRIFYSKAGDQRFLSHLDLARTWERALRRSGLPLVYSQGFNPRLRLSFSNALPTGVESHAEYLEAILEGTERIIPKQELEERIAAQLPEGLRLHHVDREVSKANRPRPCEVWWKASRSACWPPSQAELEEGLRRLDAQVRGKILECRLVPDGQPRDSRPVDEMRAERRTGAELFMRLSAEPDGSHPKPARLLEELIRPSPLEIPLRIVKLASNPESRGKAHEHELREPAGL